jgi:hypothetical protein
VSRDLSWQARIYCDMRLLPCGQSVCAMVGAGSGVVLVELVLLDCVNHDLSQAPAAKPSMLAPPDATSPDMLGLQVKRLAVSLCLVPDTSRRYQNLLAFILWKYHNCTRLECYPTLRSHCKIWIAPFSDSKVCFTHSQNTSATNVQHPAPASTTPLQPSTPLT